MQLFTIIPERIDYKLAVLVYRRLHGLAPSYLADEFVSVGDRVATASSVGFDSRSRRPSVSAKDTRQSCIPCGSGSNLEQPSVTCHIMSIIDVVQTPPQDWAVSEIVRLTWYRLMLHVTFFFWFWLCYEPSKSVLIYVTLIVLVIIIIIIIINCLIIIIIHSW